MRKPLSHPILDAPSRAELDRLAQSASLVPVFREIRYDTGTAVGAFLRARSKAPAFLFESVEGGERWGRWSYVGIGARRTFSITGDTLRHTAGQKVSSATTERPLDSFRKSLALRPFARTARLPPFAGGWVGYLSYGAVRWFEPRVPQRHGPDPDFADAEWMEVDRLIAFDNFRNTVQLVVVADLERHRTRATAFREAERELDALDAMLSRRLPKPSVYTPPKALRSLWTPKGFMKAVDRVGEYIRAGDCMQVVLSRRLEARYRGDPFELYRRIRLTSPAPYLFFQQFGPRVLAGASPEVLLRVEGGRVTVRPIAGTRRRGKTPEEDLRIEAELIADPKERAEHVMLLDLGRNDVGRVAEPGSVRIEAREVVERYSHVMHLVSQVSGELRRGLDSLDATASIFPAGTVSGAPKVRAMEIIDELEPLARGPYSGAVGYVGYDGTLDLAITIRALALAGDRLRFQAGAGLVHDSTPEREHEETSEKMRGMLASVGIKEPAR